MPASITHLAEPVKGVGAVLARWPYDGLFYAVQVLHTDTQQRKCEVIFEDGHKCWMDATELHAQLDTDKLDEALIVCCVCDSGKSEQPNELIICEQCDQSYHVNCHQPQISRDQVKPDDENVEWICLTCQTIMSQSQGPKTTKRRVSTATPGRTPKRTLKATKQTPRIKLDTRKSRNSTASTLTTSARKQPKLAVVAPTKQQTPLIQLDIEEVPGQEKEFKKILDAPQGGKANGICLDIVLAENQEITDNQMLSEASNGVIETMDPILIEAAKCLADADPNSPATLIDTDKFVNTLTEHVRSNEQHVTKRASRDRADKPAEKKSRTHKKNKPTKLSKDNTSPKPGLDSVPSVETVLIEPDLPLIETCKTEDVLLVPEPAVAPAS